MDFASYVSKKEQRARTAGINRLTTVDLGPRERPLQSVGNNWTRTHYDGAFWLSPTPDDLPGLSLVFVQSREGNTVASNPAELGGGDTDLHLIYEGLSRVAADAVLAGATTARGEMFFSVWHPEFIALRLALGLARHPAQIVMSAKGNLDLDDTLLFNVPDVPVYVLAATRAQDRLQHSLRSRPWIRLLRIEERDLAAPFTTLRTEGIRRISCVGGRTTATALINARLVQDLYLTTTAWSAGQPDSAYYCGSKQLDLELVVRKQTLPSAHPPIIFEHFVIISAPRTSSSLAP